jgi:hypothetical protein
MNTKPLFGAFFLFLAFQASADMIVGKAFKVSDGDTITVLDETHTQHKIRLTGIDAPEKNHAFGQRAKGSLSDLVFAKAVTVETDKTDRYGREVGKVLVQGIDANFVQVQRSFAWHYKVYDREQPAVDAGLKPTQKMKPRLHREACGRTLPQCHHGTIERLNLVTKRAVELPATIDGAVRLVLGQVPEDEQAQIAYMSEEDLPRLHMGLGQWVRNHLGLWSDNTC